MSETKPVEITDNLSLIEYIISTENPEDNSDSFWDLLCDSAERLKKERRLLTPRLG